MAYLVGLNDTGGNAIVLNVFIAALFMFPFVNRLLLGIVLAQIPQPHQLFPTHSHLFSFAQHSIFSFHHTSSYVISPICFIGAKNLEPMLSTSRPSLIRTIFFLMVGNFTHTHRHTSIHTYAR